MAKWIELLGALQKRAEDEEVKLHQRRDTL